MTRGKPPARRLTLARRQRGYFNFADLCTIIVVAAVAGVLITLAVLWLSRHMSWVS